jgi:Tfp pilus assembly protein PilN
MTRINLLPPEQKERASREQGIMLAVLGLVAVVLVLGAVYFLTLQKVNSKQDEVDAATGKTQTAQQRLDSLKGYEALQQQRDDMQTTAFELYDSRVYWSNVFEEISLVTPDTITLQQMICEVPGSMLAGYAFGVKGSDKPTGIQFIGQAPSYEEVAEFIARLGLLPQLINPKLDSATYFAPEADTPEFIQFQVNSYLRPFLVPPPGSVETAKPSSSSATEGG